MPKYNTNKENEAEFGDDYAKSTNLMGDLCNACFTDAGRREMGQKVGNVVDSSSMTPNKHHGIDG
jgi:hypothetical protein